MKTIFFTILIALAITNFSYSQVTEEWVRRYNGTGNSVDDPYSIAVDGSGNTFVTGGSLNSSGNFDYTTIKYNSSGTEQWVQRYNGPGNFDDIALSIAVDFSGNVYVTGSSTGSGTGLDFATVKYNTNGDSLWAARYNGPNNSDDKFASIAVDVTGNVYVSGTRQFNFVSAGYVTIKYNSSGIQQWVQIYDPPNISQYDASSKIVLDSLGNVYLTGSLGYGSPVNNSDYVTIKYNTNGDTLWTVRYSGLGNSDVPASISTDVSGNVYVTGNSSGDFATIKYNSSGVMQWVERYNGSFNGFDGGLSIAVDDSANVYVTGTSYHSANFYDYATIKYNMNGDSLWVKRYSGPVEGSNNPKAIVLDDFGNAYVSGYSSSSFQGLDFATIKYNSNGDQLWVQRYNGPANTGDFVEAIAVDHMGNVYVTGESPGIGSSYDYATIKYSQITGISQISNSNPDKFSLSQNYPNPFNPVTHLEFGIPDLGYVSLKVYDILGNEVATLVNEKLNTGDYEIEFDGSNLSSGVYFYKLQFGEFIETKRMTLIK